MRNFSSGRFFQLLEIWLSFSQLVIGMRGPVDVQGASPPPMARIARGANCPGRSSSVLLGILSDVFIGADVRPRLSQCGR